MHAALLITTATPRTDLQQSGAVRTEGCPINTAARAADCRYRIVLRGECGPLVAGMFTDVAIESGRGCTCITASVRDDSELYGLIHRFEDLALHLISLGEFGVAETAGTLR